MSDNLFSVIIPVFNRASIVSEALDSVKAQSYRPIEIIVIDDGSTDESKYVIEQWAVSNTESEFLSLHYIFQHNAGAGAARNRGIKQTCGEFVQFLDSDDRMHPQRMQRLMATFIETGADFIQTGFGGFCAETGETTEVHYGRLKDDLVSQALMGVLWANTLRSAFTRKLVEKIGFWNTEMSCFEDYEFVIRALIHAQNPVAIRDVLASARRGGEGRVSDRLKTYEGRVNRIQCEQWVCQLAAKHSNRLSADDYYAFISRIYCLGVRSYASGWRDLSLECGKIVEDIDQEMRHQRYKTKWYYLWKMGFLGGYIYKARQAVSLEKG